MNYVGISEIVAHTGAPASLCNLSSNATGLFIVMCLVTRPLNESEAGDSMLIS